MQVPRPKLLCTLACVALVALSGVLQAASDVTQPGDPVIASSDNMPGSEGVANAIDNTDAKYLNFDTRLPDNPPSGFIVTPQVGVTRVVGMTIKTANDAPERDPKTVTLEGSNDAEVTTWTGGTWEMIATVEFPATTDRFVTQTATFANFKPYKHYRWTVTAVQTPNSCCMQVAEVELLGSTLPSDVTTPSDAVIASSDNMPGSEGVANAIDNTDAKYLNFDTRLPDNPPSGFVVTPSIGKTVVTGVTIRTANDAPERDPKTVTLEGSNDAEVTAWTGGTWEMITTLEFPATTDRFVTQTALFDNYKPYAHYRWTVTAVQTPNSCCMQVAEVELLGTSAPKDVTQPGDPVIASSDNMPGSEGVANAIDNTDAKYLNFDTRLPDNPPSGFIVTPAVGATAVTGMTIKTANDAPERDPKTVTLEGSNDDTVTTWTGGTWELVATVEFPATTDRFVTQEAFFPNAKEYKHYRWTVTAVQTPNSCCMQVAEVELLAITASNPCDQTEFTLLPVDTPVLSGGEATFIAYVNGPWSVQWYKNGAAIPGATALTYTTDPVTAANEADLYTCEIVGCQTSPAVRAYVFTPSTTKSVGINFVGSGANGAPTSMNLHDDAGAVIQYDIAGVHPQAYWNNATNATGAAGDGVNMGAELLDSDGTASAIYFEYNTTGTWGAGVDTASATGRMLNGYAGGNAAGEVSTFTFTDVPAGNHSVLAYMVNAPLQNQELSITVKGAAEKTYYIRPMNSDEYKPAPGFYNGDSTNPAEPTVADFVRFNSIQPYTGDGLNSITVTLTNITGYDREVGMNGLQLVLSPASVPQAAVITTQPQPTVAAAGATARLSVVATGDGLTYQWRKNGYNVLDGGNISGATTATLTISNVSEDDVAVYSVAVFNPGGSVVSRNASLRLTTYDIKESLVGHWKLNETSGATAANAIAGGSPGNVTGTSSWGAGRIANAFNFDMATYMLVDNFTKANDAIAGCAWVKMDPNAPGTMAVFRNGHSDFNATGGDLKVLGQFELGILDVGGELRPTAAVGNSPNLPRATGSAGLSVDEWHHLAFSADGAQLRLYVNGAQVASTDYLGLINDAHMDWISIGARLVVDTNTPPAIPDATTPAYFWGSIDDIGLWTRALTANEVSKIYQAGMAGQDLETVVIEPPTEMEFTGVTKNADGSITIEWTGGGTLQVTTDIGSGVWQSVDGATSPYTFTPTAAAMFGRIMQ